MRYYPLILFVAILFAALGVHRETDIHRSADRAPASEARPKIDAPTSATEGHAATESAPTPRGYTLWPAPGERWIYRFERKAAADFGGKPWLRLKIGGRAAIEATESSGLKTNGENHFFLVSFEVDRLEMQGETRTETRAFPSARVEIDAAGKVRELRFVAAREGSAQVSDEDADLVKDLAAQWLFFEDHTRLGKAEIDWSGDLAGAAAGKKRTISKRISGYFGRAEISKLDSNHEWVSGTGEGTAAKVERLGGTENFTLASPNGDFNQSTSYKWLWTTTEKVGPRPELALGRPFTIDEVIPTGLSGAPSAPKIDPAHVAAEWSKLKSLVPHARLKLFRDAKRALDGGADELVSLVVKDLRGRTSTSIEWRTGVGVLAASSNPAAASALLALYREPGRTPDEKLSILSGVAAGEGVPAPEWKPTFEAALEASSANDSRRSSAASGSPRDEDAIVKNFDPGRDYDPAAAVREASLYALGSSIRKETDAGRRQGLETVLWKEVKDARTDEAQITVLEAIGNSGSGDYYPYVKEQFSAGSTPVRVKAVAAVRFLASDLAKPILDQARGDPAPAIRKVAEWSAKFQADASSDSSQK